MNWGNEEDGFVGSNVVDKVVVCEVVVCEIIEVLMLVEWNFFC